MIVPSIPLLFLAVLAPSVAQPHASLAASAVCDGAARATAPRGLFVEARTASVFAGACHYNSELVTSGAEALLAWRFEGGEHDGLDLAGASVVALVAGDRNLALEGARIESVLYVDGPDAPTRAAAAALVRARHGASLGRVRAQERGALRVERAGESYAVHVPGVARLEGLLMPDRACCTMPLARWYAPLSEVESSVVGRSARFEHSGGRWLGRSWSRSGHNDAQVGAFAW